MGWRTAIAGALAAGVASVAQAASLSVKDWGGVCDNTRQCAAYGFSPVSDEGLSYRRLERAGGPDAALRIAVVSRDLAAGRRRVTVAGRGVAGLESAPAPAQGETARAALTAAQTAAVVAAVRNGQALELAQEAQRSRISLAGAARPVSQARPPPAVKANLGDCDADIDSLKMAPIVARLSPGVILWAVQPRGLYVVYSLALADETAARCGRSSWAGWGRSPAAT